jgi:hypothetical protein
VTRALSLCLAYYENPMMLAVQLDALAHLPEELRAWLSLVVVDDGSPTRPAAFPERLPFTANLYRFAVDIPWNQDAARNLAAARAPADWLLLTDMDHVPSTALLDRIMRGGLYAGHVYTFARVNAPDLEPYKAHPNSWLMTRDMFDKAGGYDERFAGVYGTDGMFAKRVRAVAEGVFALKEPLIRYPREVVADASTTTLTRKSVENEERRAEIKRRIADSGERGPVRGLTEWAQIR